jgi:hypothetical protein
VPDGYVRRDGRTGGGVAVEVDVGPVHGAGFFGADPGEQAEHDVGVQELVGAADVFEAGPQFHHGQGAGVGDDCGGLIDGEGFGRAAGLSYRSSAAPRVHDLLRTGQLGSVKAGEP